MNLRPVPRVSGIVHRAPGGAPVGMNYVQMLAAASARRVGVNGTRGLYNAVVGQGPGVTIVPLVRTPAQGVLVSARSMWDTGTTKVGPRGARAPGLAGISGLGTTEEEAKSRLGTPKQSGEWITESSKNSLWDCASFTHKRACEIGQKGMEGACRPCGTGFGVKAASSGPSGSEGATLTTLKDVLTQFEARLRAGTIDPDSAFPTGSSPIPPLVNEANRSLYNDVTTIHDTLIPSARATGRMYRSLNAPVSSGGSSTSSGSTTTTSGGTTTPVYQQPVYQQPTSSASDDPYITQIPNDLYGGASDPVTGTVAPPSASPGKVVAATPAAPAISRRRPAGAAIAVGLVVVLGGAYALSRRKGKSRSRSRR